MSLLDRQWFSALSERVRFASLLALVIVQMVNVQVGYAQHSGNEHVPSHAVGSMDQHHGANLAGGWEGSVEGIAYSEFNHKVAGLLILLIGIFEMSLTLRSHSPSWARFVLPGALGVVGMFLLVWSDHEAWPIGQLSFTDSFFGNDYEIIQHKLYGVLAMTVALSEILRRTGLIGHVAWAVPLPLFAILGGVMLFGHSHGIHPSAHKIAVHHAIMGAMAMTAGSSKLMAAWAPGSWNLSSSRWELLWGGLIMLIGVQLLLYSE